MVRRKGMIVKEHGLPYLDLASKLLTLDVHVLSLPLFPPPAAPPAAAGDVLDSGMNDGWTQMADACPRITGKRRSGMGHWSSPTSRRTVIGDDTSAWSLMRRVTPSDETSL